MTTGLFWYRGSGVEQHNFGDSIAPHLVRGLAGLEPVWQAMPGADLVTIGSVMSKVPDGWPGIVLGTGTIRSGLVRDLRRAIVLCLRGERTREACLPSGNPTLGDPGILAPDLFPAVRPLPRHDVVIVPHYIDHEMARRYPKAVRVDILADHRTVLAGIASAKLVVTSSLHALVAADALGVPQVLEPHPAVIGGLWKFEDYVSAFGLSIQPNTTRLTPRPLMTERQNALRACFRGLAGAVTRYRAQKLRGTRSAP